MMKKILLGAAVLVSTLASAQFSLQLSETRFGLIGGVTRSGVKNAHNPSGQRTSFFAGGLALTPLDYDNQFFIQTQVEYLEAGETGGEAVYANNYLSVPVYFKTYFSEAENEFFGFLGPRFGFLVNQKVDKPSREAYKIENEGKAGKFDFAISGGIGFSYRRQWEISGRYDWGFSNTFPRIKEIDINDPALAKNKPQHIISVGVSFIFE